MSKHTSKLAILVVAAWSSIALAEGQHIDGKNYQVDVKAATCKAGKECSAVVKLDLGAGYHLNKEYPYKVAVADVDGAIKYSKPVFGRPSGDFVEANEQSGTITVKFTPAKAGKLDVLGTFKFAVCSDHECATATENIKLSVDVKK